MTPPGFEDDFAKGEKEAARLVARMRASLDRAEAFEKSAQRDAQLRQRLRNEGEAEARAGETTKPSKTPEQTVRDRIKSEERLNKAIEERALLERRATEQTDANAAANRRAAEIQKGPGSSIVATGGAGGRQPPREPPRYFAQRPPPERPGGRRGLPPGPSYKQIPERTGPPYPGQLALPGAGQTGQGAKFFEDEAKAKRASANAGRVYAEATDAQTRSSRVFAGTLAQETAFQRSANLEFQRYGALSTEWIGATARGATTIQELGRQTTATIGKFGGWLGAGALLFAALDTVRAIGHGAIESASGVNQLERVMTNVNGTLAQAQFRDYSQAFNLPIADVSQAAYEMGKIFHDQNEAFEATKAVLYSVKVGELDTATASRYLIAIINGFHLPANQLVTVFDQLNGAQNKFGITISDVEAGLAKASGSFNAATTKGSPLQKYHELLALITTAQKATGQTGQVVGTAIQRAPNFLRQQKNKNILKRYGIEAGADLNEIITQAFERAQSLPGHKIAELASAIFGPQYGARIGTPLFQQYDLYKKVLAGTTVDKTKNSGQRELNTLLGTYGERLHKVGVELESIGSGLAEAGFLNIFGLGLEALTQMLSVTNNVLDAFNHLPGPLKDSLAILIEMRLAVAALRKFNLGDNFAPGSLGRRVFSGPNREARLYREQLIGSEETQRRALESTNTAIGGAGRRVATSEATLAAEREQLAVLRNSGASKEAILAQQINVNRAEAALEGNLVKQLDLAQERMVILSELNAIEQTNSALKGNFTDTEARNLAARRGEAIPTSFGRGRMSAQELARQAGYELRGNGTFVPYAGASGLDDVRRAAAMKAEEEAALARGPKFSEAGAAWKSVGQRDASLLHPIKSLTSARGDAAAASLTTARAVRSSLPTFTTLRTSLTSAAQGLKGLGSSLYDLAGGPIGLLIGGAFLAAEYGDDLGRALAGGQREISRVAELEKTGGTQNAGDARKYIKLYEKKLEDAGVSIAELERLDAEFGGHVSGAPSGAPGYFDSTEFLQQKRLLEAQQKAIAAGGSVPNLYGDTLKAQLDALKGLKPGTEHYRSDIQRVRENIKTGNFFGKKGEKEQKQLLDELKQLEARNLNASANVAAFFKSYNAIADKLLLNYIKNLGTLVSAGPAFAGQKDLHRFTNASIVQGVRDLVSNKPAIQAKGAQTLQELPQILGQYEQQELKTSLTLARTQHDRERAYSRYIGSLKRSLKGVRRAFGGKGQEISRKLAATQKEIREYEAQGKAGIISPQMAHEFGISPQDVKGHEDDRRQLEELRERAKRLRRAGQEISQQQRHAERELKALLAEQREAQIQEHVGVLSELGELAAARVGSQDPVGQARATLAYAEKALAYVRRRKGSPQDLRQAQLAVLNARQQLEESVRSEAQELASANQSLAQARAHGDPIKEAQAEINKARADLNLARTTAERRNALAELINAEHKLEEDRANIAIASLQLEAAQTDNPVKQAAIKVREADLKVKQAHGKQAKLEARAARAAAIREHRDAVAQQSIENVEFQADLGRITADQEIAAYTRLLRTLKLSKETKRQLIEKIHALQEEASGSLELTVGNIQLPTIYDIRRAVGGGVNGSRERNSHYSDNSHTEVNININGGDPERVGRVVHDTIERATKNSRRSAGMTKR